MGEHYTLGRKIGKGAFGDVYLATHTDTKVECAVKLEHSAARNPQLLCESKLLKYLQGHPQIPHMYWDGTEGSFNVLVMDLLGASLEDQFNSCHRRFSLNTVLMIAVQVLEVLEYLHSKHYIHRDIKPENFLVGKSAQAGVIYLIDFGLAQKYRDPKTHKHISNTGGKHLTGTARYASINAHCGNQQSRRDDLEALGYMLVYFLKGALPWQSLPAATKGEKYERIKQAKLSIAVEDLCRGLPEQFTEYLNYCRALEFDERPDYLMLRQKFQARMAREGKLEEFVFDWVVMEQNGLLDTEEKEERVNPKKKCIVF